MGQCRMAAGTVAAFCKVAGTATAENKTRIRIVIIKVFIKCKIESIETILSARTHAHAHTHTSILTIQSLIYTKLHNLKRAASREVRRM